MHTAAKGVVNFTHTLLYFYCFFPSSLEVGAGH